MNTSFFKLLAWVCLGCLLSLAAQAAPESRVSQPLMQPSVSLEMRHHGYQLGDLLTQTVRLQWPAGYALETNSIPLTGPVKPWLDLAQVQYQVTQQGGELKLIWQLFATVEQTQPLRLPALSLKVRHTSAAGQSKVETLVIPASTFYYSSVIDAEAKQTARLPSRRPLLYATTHWQWLTALGITMSLVFLLLALWVQDRLPSLPFRPGPLTRLHRQWQRDSTMATPHAHQLYLALCESAGQRLYRHNIHQLFLQADYLQAYQGELSAFLARYWQQRYASEANPTDLHINDMQWMAAIAWRERLHRRALSHAPARMAEARPSSVQPSSIQASSIQA